MNTINLERMTFGAQQTISGELARDFAIPPRVRIEEMVYDNLAVTVRQEIFAQHLDRAIVRHPDTWRDAVKERFYAWLRSGHWPWGADLMERQWPIQWREVTIDVKALYPKIAMPQERHSVVVVRVEDMSDVSQRLWFDAKERDMVDLLHRLYYEGRQGRSWSSGIKAYHELIQARDWSNQYLIAPPITGKATLFGMEVTIDRTLPQDTIELRDAQDRIIGKIYNIG